MKSGVNKKRTNVDKKSPTPIWVLRSSAHPQADGELKNSSIDITVSTKQGSSSILSTQQKIQRGDIKNDKSIHSTKTH